MTARAPVIGSTTSQALGLTFLHSNTNQASRAAGLALGGRFRLDVVEADRSCRASRYSAISITITLISPFSTTTEIYGEMVAFSLKLKINQRIISVNC